MKRPKNLQEFRSSLEGDQPPSSWTVELRALWWDAKGDWSKAHEYVDNLPTPEAKWIHAYLHRKEGDLWNADYWYSSAGRSRPSGTLDEEFSELLRTLLDF